MTLNELAIALSTSLDRTTIVDRALEAIVKHLPFERALIILADESRHILAGARSIGGSAELAAIIGAAEISLDNEDAQLVEIYRSDGPVVYHDVDSDPNPDNRALAAALGVTSYLGTPLVTQGRSLGVLAVDNGLSGRTVRPSDGPLLYTLGSLVAAALENALLYGEVEAQKAELEARVVQRTEALARAIEEAQAARATAEAASAVKSQFLSNVSHELRTPLTVVQGYVEAVSDGTAGSRSAEYLRIAHDHCQRLARMIDEVLHVARLEQGVAKRHLEWAPVSLSEVVKGVVRGQRAEAMAKGVKLNARLADVPVLTGDQGLLQSLVFHLIENAVKFTAAGGHVEVALETLKDEVHFRVKDDGIGIPADLHGRVFEKFFMVDASPSKAQGGAGIGLYLAREVAVIHGGHIELRSTPGEGSVFEVCLPVRPRVA